MGDGGDLGEEEEDTGEEEEGEGEESEPGVVLAIAR